MKKQLSKDELTLIIGAIIVFIDAFLLTLGLTIK